jgi:hypothetical protein
VFDFKGGRTCLISGGVAALLWALSKVMIRDNACFSNMYPIEHNVVISTMSHLLSSRSAS